MVQIAATAALLLAAAEVFVDWMTWIELNVSIIYVLPLVVAALTRNRRFLWVLTGGLACFTIVVYARQHAVLSLHDQYLVNRLLAIVNLLLGAVLLHVLIVAFDALDRRGREAEGASRRKTRLLASVSHDLRTPITTINLIANLIHRAAETPELAAQLAVLSEDLQRSAVSLSDLVANAFDMSQLDSGRSLLHESEFALDVLVAGECRALEPAAAAKSLYLKHSVEPLRIRADPVKLARVVRNLVNNAIKFTDTGGVAVEAGLAHDGSVRISVADSGIGIAPENLERVFDEFARVEPDEAERAGWGLGLAICRRLIGLMDGSVSARIRPEGGSVFTVALPSRRVAGSTKKTAGGGNHAV
jgi:signal transduction histidine kinase